ncbi:cDP-diacylglycerol--glycerol-3-phosphate 3-phosphatidyltransferase [Clostridium sp. CAG:557]|nr:cDP-diacylglycerol--glycerol-3-phosphate 3-phosphatidyltransferase [Clostridium sp. CAG:557]
MLNAPNKITIFRIFLIPILIILLLVTSISNRFFLALIVFLVASFTDHLDGKLARKYGQITTFGKFLDPLADKMLVMSAFICFVDLNLISSVPVIIILLREFLVTSMRLVAMSSGKVVAANIWGRTKTVTQLIAIIVILVSQCFSTKIANLSYNELNFISSINNFFVWISVFFTVFSGYIYMKENFYIIKNSK